MKWYEADKQRIVQEFLKVSSNYPDFKPLIINGTLAWEGKVNDIPPGLCEPPLEVRIFCLDTYPIKPPVVYPLSPEIPKEHWGHEWHRYSEGFICYVKPKLWNAGYFVRDVIEQVEIWYYNYLCYKNGLIENMPDSGKAEILLQGEKN